MILVYKETSIYIDQEFREHYGFFANIIETEQLPDDYIILEYE